MSDKSFPRVFFPDERARTVRDIDYQELGESGIKAVIFDLDNTIARWGDSSLESEILDIFDRLKELGLKIGILSNGQRKETKNFVLKFPFPHLFNAGKPRRKGFRFMLDELNVSPEEAAMIGDQLFTDVLGANRMEMYTIRVDPIDPGREFRMTKINRVGERLLLSSREIYRYLRGLLKGS